MKPLLTIALLLSACGGHPPDSADAPAATGPSLADADALLQGTWPAQLESGARELEAVLNAPGGDGWVALFHGDLAAAERSFSSALGRDPNSGPNRLGLFRVHLARAEAYDVAWQLHQEGAAALARYRSEHQDRVRLGAYEQALARLTPGSDGGDSPREGVAQTPNPEISAALAALDPDPAARARAPVPSGLPAGWSARLRFADAVFGGDLESARGLLDVATSAESDLVDPLGQDPDSGLVFEAPFFDPVRLLALRQFHLLEGRRIAGTIPDLGEDVVRLGDRFGIAVAEQAPDADAATPAPAISSAPRSLLTFGSTWMSLNDLHATQESPENALMTRVRSRLPEWFARTPSNESIDRELRAAEALELRFGESLGAGMAADLRTPRLLRDAILRRRMLEVADSHPTLALRLGRRSLDVNPGAVGGASDSSRTRVSFRNDRAFLLRLARQLWLAGQPGEALDLVHPLAQEDRALQPVVHYLGQLDAANSVGTAGKASQL